MMLLVPNSGFVELLTRIAQYGRLSTIKTVSIPPQPQDGNEQDESDAAATRAVPYVSTLLRLMDASGGKDKLIHLSRKSVAIRKFVYAPSPTSPSNSLKQKNNRRRII